MADQQNVDTSASSSNPTPDPESVRPGEGLSDRGSFTEFATALVDYLEMQWHPDPGRHAEQADKLNAVRKSLGLPEKTVAVEETQAEQDEDPSEAKE